MKIYLYNYIYLYIIYVLWRPCVSLFMYVTHATADTHPNTPISVALEYVCADTYKLIPPQNPGRFRKEDLEIFRFYW